jgi:hypothetical protein
MGGISLAGNAFSSAFRQVLIYFRHFLAIRIRLLGEEEFAELAGFYAR